MKWPQQINSRSQLIGFWLWYNNEGKVPLGKVPMCKKADNTFFHLGMTDVITKMPMMY